LRVGAIEPFRLERRGEPFGGSGARALAASESESGGWAEAIAPNNVREAARYFMIRFVDILVLFDEPVSLFEPNIYVPIFPSKN
jgi:hypothetical protein